MPDPDRHPHYQVLHRTAWAVLVVGIVLTLVKFAVFVLTNSAAVLSDALESIINLVAASLVLYSIWLSNRPADADHPYGHGKVEFVVAAVEGGMVLVAGVVIIVEAIRRLIGSQQLHADQLTLGLWLLGGIGLVIALLAGAVLSIGKRHGSVTLIADAKHLMTDAVSTLAVIVGLGVVKITGQIWIDPVVAVLIAVPILWTGRKLLREALDGLMDRADERDQALLRQMLDTEVDAGVIEGYHKLRHRHSGRFHWVDMHLQVRAEIDVAQAHELASRIEHAIEQELAPCNATAHVEPAEPDESGKE